MGREIEVVYANGVFKPLEPVRLPEGEQLRLYIPRELDGLTKEERIAKNLEIQKEFAEGWAELSEEDKAFLEEAWQRRR